MMAKLLSAADKYDLPVLFKKCELSLSSSINVVNAIDYFIVAYLHEATIMLQITMGFIIDNYSLLKDTPEMLLIVESHPKALLKLFEFSLASTEEDAEEEESAKETDSDDAKSE
jgi:hypothetical protein